MSLDPRRRRALLVAGLVWAALGVAMMALGGGIGGFTPDDPVVPLIGFQDAGDGRVAIDAGPTSLREAKGIEIRSGSEAQSGRVLWKVHRTSATKPADGRVVIGETPEGFTVDQPLEADLPTTWHAEVDNACFLGSAVAPVGLRSDVLTLENGDRVALGTIAESDAGFTDCNSGSFADRAGLFLGLISLAVGGVLLTITWLDFRHRMPTA